MNANEDQLEIVRMWLVW